jgi:dTDP-4-dehydrorhamnose reductase
VSSTHIETVNTLPKDRQECESEKVCYSSSMTQKILLTGKAGQVGAELCTTLPRLGEVFAFDHSTLDLIKPAQIREVIRSVQPDVIINAAAYTAVDRAETEPLLARAINAEAPALIAEEAKNCGALLIHYSTDYVFDGSKHSPYHEDDAPNPVSVYGQTKLDGERGVQNSRAAHLIFRTAWVYGTRGRNFLLTILRLATDREELRIVRDQLGAPTWSREIAYATASVLSNVLRQPREEFASISGVYHMTASGVASWHDFATSILERAKETPSKSAWFAEATRNRPLLTQRIVPISTSEYPTPARRPAYSVLSNEMLKHRFGLCLPDWQQQLRSAFLDEPAKTAPVNP